MEVTTLTLDFAWDLRKYLQEKTWLILVPESGIMAGASCTRRSPCFLTLQQVTISFLGESNFTLNKAEQYGCNYIYICLNIYVNIYIYLNIYISFKGDYRWQIKKKKIVKILHARCPAIFFPEHPICKEVTNCRSSFYDIARECYQST